VLNIFNTIDKKDTQFTKDFISMLSPLLENYEKRATPKALDTLSEIAKKGNSIQLSQQINSITNIPKRS